MESARIVFSAESLSYDRMLLVAGITERSEEFLEAGDPATILGWAGSRTLKAGGVLLANDALAGALHENLMQSAVPEIILVGSRSPGLREVESDRMLPSRQRHWSALDQAFSRNAEEHRFVGFSLINSEDVKMTILPSHRILNRDMKIPEAV